MLAGSRAAERGAVVEAAAPGSGRQVPRAGPRGGRAGRRRPGPAAAGGAELRRRAGDGLRRRFDLALVDGGLRSGRSSGFGGRSCSGWPRRTRPRRAASGSACPSGGSPRPSASSSPSAPPRPSGEPIADADVQGRDRLPRRHPPPLAAGASGGPDAGLGHRHAGRRRLRHRSHGGSRKTSRWVRPGRGSWSSARTSSSTTPRPTPTR